MEAVKLKEQPEMKTQQLHFLAGAINLGLKLLSMRIFIGFVFSNIIGLFWYVVQNPSLYTIITGSIFGVLGLAFVALERRAE